MATNNSKQRDSRPLLVIFLVILFLISSSSILLVFRGHTIDELPSFVNNISSSSSSFSKNFLSNNQPSNAALATQSPPINYSQIKKFYTPIEISIYSPSSVQLSMCSLNFEDYSKNPHEYSMFRYLVANSGCFGSNTMSMKLYDYLTKIEEEIATESRQYEASNPQEVPEGFLRFTPPKLFVFHESRVGSTLIANLLASDPHSMVFSESSPIITALLHCNVCSHEQKVELFRAIIRAMSVSRYHKNLFVKFQSIGSTGMALALEAFPDIAWIYAFRQPVQTMMSHLDPLKASSGAPCLRSKSSPPAHILELLASKGLNPKTLPKEGWCAAHLEMLSSHALEAAEKFSMNTKGELRGLLINYETLPGIIPRVVFPLADISLTPSWLSKMTQESQEYSKSGSSEKPKFVSDSEDKEQRSTEKINEFSSLLLEPTFEKMVHLNQESLKIFQNEYFFQKSSKNIEKNSDFLSKDVFDTEKLKSFPILKNIQTYKSHQALNFPDITGSYDIPHSPLLIENYFSASSPFANDHSSKRFDMVDCSLPPSEDYPKAYPFFDVIGNWNPDDVKIPPRHYDSLCHFDFSNSSQLALARLYQKAEKPFILYNIPELDEISAKWSTFDYLIDRVGNTKFRTESSHSNHFMYWKYPSNKFLRTKESKSWEEPTSLVKRTLKEWLNLAIRGQGIDKEEEREHEYFRLNSDPENPWIYDDLPFFNPSNDFSSHPFPFLVDARQQRGIHCRLGMRSVIAEAHFDASRNMVVELAGLRRWILAHPNQCGPLDLYPPEHPSARHSKGDWSKPETLDPDLYGKGLLNEVILRPGDALFVPTDWIHYIVSLNVNIQCNTRSGLDRRYRKDLAKCGFFL